MNCANHPDTAPVAYCRTCGKPLCAELHSRRQGRDLLRELPGRAAARRPAGRRAARGRIRFDRSAPIVPGTRAESYSRRHSRRILSLRRGRGLLRTVCQGSGAPGDFHAVWCGARRLSTTTASIRFWAWASRSFTCGRSSIRYAPPKPFRWGSHHPTRSDWLRLLEPPSRRSRGSRRNRRKRAK